MDMQVVTPEHQLNDFERLVHRLNEVLGPYKGIDSDDIDPKELEQLMIDYVSDDAHWQKYFFPSEHQAYTRNLVDRGNGKCNLVSSKVNVLRRRPKECISQIRAICESTIASIRMLTLIAHSGVVTEQVKSDSRVSQVLNCLGRENIMARSNTRVLFHTH